jgi:DNA polymerase III alpha subunit (gram-positive type)
LIVEDGQVVEEYDKFINIDKDLPQDITKITGITDKMLIMEGVSEKTVADDLKNNLAPNTLMIAHNCQFDLSFIYYLLKRHYPDEVDEILSNLDWIDTLTVLKDRKKYPHKLIDAVEHYNIPKVNFHRAIDDTKALYDVTQALIDERPDLDEYIIYLDTTLNGESVVLNLILLNIKDSISPNSWFLHLIYCLENN